MKFTHRQYLLWIALVIAIGGAALKFYHYNYVQNKPGQARLLRMPGLIDFVCRGVPNVVGNIDHCGKRSVYGQADWGVTAYTTIYGIETVEEARDIVEFMRRTRREQQQENIPAHVEIFSAARSQGSSRPSKYKIWEESL